MRPVDKGAAPKKIYNKYQDAQRDLIERLGAYCSYCELPIQNAPEVEHKEAKAKGGEVLQWENFLLSCKYCNTRKNDKVAAGEKEKYFWPDEDNTMKLFDYTGGQVVLNDKFLDSSSNETREKAEALLQLLHLDNIPTPKQRDRRYEERLGAWFMAQKYRKDWDLHETSVDLSKFSDCIGDIAKLAGFFTLWIQVFCDCPQVCQAIVDKFPGTRSEFLKEYLPDNK